MLSLHKKKGLNPHLTVCSNCGGPTNEIVLIGAHAYIGRCQGCGLTIYRQRGGACPKCKGSVEYVRGIEDNERLTGGLCDKCTEEQNGLKAEVVAGGIYWRCSDCQSHGVLKRTSELAIAVRRQMKIEAPAPCGVEFSKTECPACGPDADART